MPATEVVDGAPGKRHGAFFDRDDQGSVKTVGGLACDGSRNVQPDGSCADGCCSYYRCDVCGERFRVEWPA